MINKEHKSADFAYLFTEKIAHKLFDPIFLKSPLTTKNITWINFFVNDLGAVLFFSLGKYWANLVALAFVVAAVIWDWMDGMVAREKKQSSKGPAFLDPALDFIWQHLIVAGIAIGVYRNSGNNFVWVIIGYFALVSLLCANYFIEIFDKKFGFGFRGDYDEFIKEVEQDKKTDWVDKLILEVLTLRKFIFIFIFTIRYSLLLGAVFNRLDIFLIFVALSYFIRTILLFYIYYFYLESGKRERNRILVVALINRSQYWESVLSNAKK